MVVVVIVLDDHSLANTVGVRIVLVNDLVVTLHWGLKVVVVVVEVGVADSNLHDSIVDMIQAKMNLVVNPYLVHVVVNYCTNR